MESTQPTSARAPAQDFDWPAIALQVLRSRRLDELEEAELAPTGEVPYQFSAKGHELAQVLLGLQLTQGHDAAGVYYRSRPFMLAAGLELDEALAAGMGMAGSPSEGRDVGVVFSLPPRRGVTVLPASGDVGAQYTPAAGWAQAINYQTEVLGDRQWQGAIAVALGGEGSVASNGFWSALTIATTQQLPMLFFIEDNGYGISVPGHFQTPGGDIAANLAAFEGLTVLSGSGTEPAETAALVAAAVAGVRGGDGPCLLRLQVPRLAGHTFIDNQAYKDGSELEAELASDPLPALAAHVGQATWEALDRQARQEVAQALERARARRPHDEAAARYLFFDGTPALVGGSRHEPGPAVAAPNLSGPRINMIEAVRGVMEQTLRDNPRAVVFGEDVGAKGGVHGATVGLQAAFGQQRVFDTSLSEEGIIGRAVGMALAGLLPIPEIQFRKYADPATEQINDLGTLRWRTAGKFAAPIVVRLPVGFSKKIGDPWHSVTGEAVFAHTLGWRLAFPSNAADAAGLLRQALRDQDPTFFFEHRALLDSAEARRPDPGPDYCLPFGQVARLLTGDSLTLVTWGAMVHRCLEAAKAFVDRVDLLDLRTIAPWDRKAVLESVRRTGKVLIVHEDTWTAGFGAEVASTIAEQAFEYLDGPPRRLATPDVPIPYSLALMGQVLPGVEAIAAAIDELLTF